MIISDFFIFIIDYMFAITIFALQLSKKIE
jgi:hypothetical protein